VDKGNTVVVIEHNLDVIKCADWIIDIGPESGDKGGYLLFEGPPEELIHHPHSHTAKSSKAYFKSCYIMLEKEYIFKILAFLKARNKHVFLVLARGNWLKWRFSQCSGCI